MCSAPKQGLTLPASVDLEKETVITGRVVDGSGQAVGGAFVRWLDASNEFTAEVVGRLKDRGVLSFASVGSTDSTANRPAAWARLAAMGAAGAQTDYSAELFDWQNSR